MPEDFQENVVPEVFKRHLKYARTWEELEEGDDMVSKMTVRVSFRVVQMWF